MFLENTIVFLEKIGILMKKSCIQMKYMFIQSGKNGCEAFVDKLAS